jgi:hypothetical protein
MWKLNKIDIVYHCNNWWKPGYEPIESIASWPAHGDESIGQSRYLAPFIDVNGDGWYNPYHGDYPLIKGDQCEFFIFNDLRFEGRESHGSPIGIEIHGMLYEFNQPEKLFMHNTVFLSYKIFNRSNYTLDSTYLGIWTDFDLGYAFDDYVGCDVSRGMYFVYNAKDIDGNGEPTAYGENPPAQGILFLGGPTIEDNGLDDPKGGCDISMNGAGFGDGIIDNERLGMTGFVYHNNGGNPQQSDPNNALEYYNYLKGIWKEGEPIYYGGFGYPTPPAYGPECRFMFPGVSDTCNWGTNGLEPNGSKNWSEENANYGEPNPAADRRGLGSTGPFTFNPGDVQKIDIAYVVARGDDGPLSSVELLKVYADSLRSVFSQNSDDFGTQYLGMANYETISEEIKIYPNPAGILINVEIPGTRSKTPFFVIYDLYGRKMLNGLFENRSNTTIELSDLKSGIYILAIDAGDVQYSGRIIKD